MTKHQIIELYGQSVYEIWLRVAIKAFDFEDALASFEAADEFVTGLLERDSPI